MNIYQQNNTSVRSTVVVQIVNVTFYNVVVDSNINTLLGKLKVSFSELGKCLKLNMPVNDIKSKAIEINSTIEVLMNSVVEVEFNSKDQFVKSLVESCVAVVERYREAENIIGFGVELKGELISECRSFFEREFGRYLDANFWYKLRYYEWLSKEGFARKGSQRYHSDEELEHFFSENRTRILNDMLYESRDYNNQLQVNSPLNDQKIYCYFQTYKILTTAT